MSNTSRYQLICGMEVHAELKTNSKMFCGCKNDPFYAEKANSHTCPVCLGLPGALPTINKKAVEWTIMLGLALHCKINLFSKFDRKHYFYPDLPKGYQISQYDLPFCYDGYLDTEFGKVRIRRIHLEEDTGKLIHRTLNGERVSLIDFNRSSVPLIEIVTEPDIHTAEQAKAYGKALRQILRFLDIADCDMEQGGMRLEANISLSPDGNLPNYKVELKNINSFRFMEKAIEFEMERQAGQLDQGETPIQETRGWNDQKGETFSQRTKEDAEDYRYFPDPDLPPMRFTEEYIEKLRAELPELPANKLDRWQKEFGVEKKFATFFLEEKADAQWAEELFKVAQEQKVNPNDLANAVANKKIPVVVPKTIPLQVIETYQAATHRDEVDPEELDNVLKVLIAENPAAVEQYKAGKTQVAGFFIGQTQKKLGKKIDATVLMSRITALLNA
jgi:aspartyl-tRNA(Asn)/glutamyl-tRNA(Gln) amidotransferase subunit B